MTKVLSRDDILNAQDLQRKELHVPEWGGNVYVRLMTGMEREQFEELVISEKGNGHGKTMARFAAFCLVNAQGERLFTAEDIDKLAAKSGKALKRVLDEIMSLNAMTEESLEALEKN